MEKLYAANKAKVHFFVVYIREAHPTDGWALPNNKFKITDPKSLEERQKAAREFAKDLKLTLPILVDALDDQVNNLYGGWPDRVYVIDADGKIALKGGMGPGGFTPSVKAASGVLEKLTK
ncbi:MAG: deiodinase [Planctomycetes bacterium]|nr:deiodinase [Planctomycetota bacterium]